jgi:TolB-like protein
MSDSLLDRVKHRKIVQWALAYLAGAWVLYEVVSTVGEPWGLTDGFFRLLFAGLLLGFFVTLVLAWYHGEQGRQRVSGPELILIAGLFAIGGLLVNRMEPRPADVGTSPDPGSTEMAVAPAPDLARRIAVLPLENLTGDPGSEHVVQGLHEAITYGLGTIRSLEVISRTSVLGYAGTTLSAAEIAAELQAGSLLDGSVSAQGDSVRITLNLIDPARETDEWTGRFRGELGDLLRLQDEIAREVARQLRAHLTPREDSLLATSPRIDPRAGDLYLRARSEPNRMETIDLLNEAIRIDPSFAAAYGELARRYGEIAFNGGLDSLTPDDLYDRVVRLAERGLQIDSTLSSAYAALGEARYHRDWDLEGGMELFRKALDMNPSYSIALMRISGHAAAMGRMEESIEAVRTAQRVDPNWTFAWGGAAYTRCHVGDWEDAVREAETALEMDPGYLYARALRGQALVNLGRHEEGMADLQAAADSVELAIALAKTDRMEEAIAMRAALADPARDARTPPFDLARVYAQTGGLERAVALLEQAAEEKAGQLMWLNVEPDLEVVRGDPRIQDLLTRMKFPAPAGD